MRIYAAGVRQGAGKRGAGMENGELQNRLDTLRVEHRDLDSAIDSLIASGSNDQLQVARLKKRKLRLKDEIGAIEDMMIPDIIA